MTTGFPEEVTLSTSVPDLGADQTASESGTLRTPEALYRLMWLMTAPFQSTSTVPHVGQVVAKTIKRRPAIPVRVAVALRTVVRYTFVV